MSKITYTVTVENGNKAWYLNGKLHREDGPAIDEFNGNKFWYINDKLHREDGPAVEEFNGNKFWYINGKLHREDGPALEYSNGDKYWYLNGEEYTESEFKANTQPPKDLTVAELEDLLGYKIKIIK